MPRVRACSPRSPSPGPLHRRRGVHEAPARAGGVKAYAEALADAPASHSGGVCPSRRRRGRHAGRRVLLRLRDAPPARSRCRRRADRGALVRPGAGARRTAHGDAARLQTRATWASTSTALPASQRQATAGRCSCPPRRPRSWTVRPRDLGEHRFKDLLAAERVYQLGEPRVPTPQRRYRLRTSRSPPGRSSAASGSWPRSAAWCSTGRARDAHGARRRRGRRGSRLQAPASSRRSSGRDVGSSRWLPPRRQARASTVAEAVGLRADDDRRLARASRACWCSTTSSTWWSRRGHRRRSWWARSSCSRRQGHCT